MRPQKKQSSLYYQALRQWQYAADLIKLDPTVRNILMEPKNALVKQYQLLFEMESVDLAFHEDALRAISRKAIERKTGARGLRSIMEAILLDTMFELPGLKGVKEVVISGEVVDGDARPLYIYEDRAESSATSA